MTMTANLVVSLCEQSAYMIREDLNLINEGRLKIYLDGEDITEQQSERIRAALSRVLEIVDGCGCHCV